MLLESHLRVPCILAPHGTAKPGEAERRCVRLARPDIERHLEAHLRFLFSSARAYDEGFEDEAKRLAVSIRAICHETRTSRSLLAQLDLAGVKSLTDTADHIDPSNLADTWGLVVMRATLGSGSPLCLRLLSWPRFTQTRPRHSINGGATP